MADVEDATIGSPETSSERKESEEEVPNEAREDGDISPVEVANIVNSDSAVDARTQLANLISLVQSVESSTGEPDHKKVVYEVFGTVFKQKVLTLLIETIILTYRPQKFFHMIKPENHDALLTEYVIVLYYT